VELSHNFSVWALLADASVLPSCEKAIDKTVPVCHGKVVISTRPSISQSFTGLSQLADASVLPSGEKASDRTGA
jgi:hypothetical protein